MLHVYGGSGGDSALSDPQAARTATTWNAINHCPSTGKVYFPFLDFEFGYLI